MSLPRPVNYGDTSPQYRLPIVKQATADATGAATITLDPIPPGYLWLVDYVVVGSTSTLTSAVNVYDGQPDFTTLIDGTPTLGNSGVAAYQPPRILRGSRQLLAAWTGCTPGATCTLRVEYRQQTEV